MKKRALSILLSLSLILCLLPVVALGTMSSRGTGGLPAGRGGTAPRLLAGTEELGPELPGMDGAEQPEAEGPEEFELPGSDGAEQPEAESPEEFELPGSDGPVQPEAEGPEEPELPGSDGAEQPEAESPEEFELPGTDGLEQLETLSSYVESYSLEAEQESGRATPEAAFQFEANGAFYGGTLAQACANVYPGGGVVVLRDIELEKGVTVTKPMTIVSDGDAQYKITYTSKTRGDPPLLTVDTTGQVLLADIILDGGREEGREAHTELVRVYRGNVKLAAGAVLQNNDNVDTYYQENSGGVWLISGVVAMGPDSAIRGCRGITGGGAGVATQNAQFGLLGGIIEDCEASRGGGIYVKGNGRLFLQDGSFLCNNRARREFNGVTYETVRQAGCGGGVYVDVGLVVLITSGPKVTGCSVTGNTAEGHGGGMYLNDCVAQLTQGSVTGNRAEGYGGGLLVTPDAGVSLTGGVVTVEDNTSGNGYFCNIYLDGSPDSTEADYPGYLPTRPITINASLPDTASIGVSRWVRPDKDHPYRVVAVPNASKGNRIQESDLGKFYSDDPNYILLLKDGNIVLTTAKVVFDNQDHGPEVPGQELGADHLVDEPDKTKMKASGYEFEGWYKEPECEPPWDFNSEITEDTDDERRPILTLYAKWDLLHYEIVYELEGGENAENNPGEYTVESDPIFLEEPTREGYRFTGWKLVAIDDDAVLDRTAARSFRALPNIPAGSTGKRTFEAQWEELPKYTVTYEDGVGGAAFAQQVTEVYEGDATPAFVGGTPAREGYTFTGWSPEVADKVTKTVTYVAQWEKIPTYTVTYQDGVGGAAFAPQVTEVYQGDATPAFAGTPTREGYIFKGWSPEVADKVTDDAVYTAQWEEFPKYTVTYQDGVGGAAFAPQVTEVYQGDATPAFVGGTPAREGYIFKGWSPEVADKVTGDAVYTAQWEEAPKPPDPPGPSGGGSDDDDSDPPKGPDPGPGEEPPQDPDPGPDPDPGGEPSPDPGTDPDPDPGAEPAPDPGEGQPQDPAAGPSPKPDPMPQTGDPTHTALWAGCALASLAGIVLVLRPQRRRR